MRQCGECCHVLGEIMARNTSTRASLAVRNRVIKSIAGTSCTVKVFADPQSKENDELSWDTCGDMGIKQVTEEVLSVAQVDFRFGQCSCGRQRCFSEWRFVSEKHGIMVFKKPVKGSSTIFMGRGVIEAPLLAVAEFLKDIENSLSWDRFLVEARCVKVLSQSEAQTDYIGYKRFESTKCFLSSHRDMLCYYRSLYKDGKYIMAAISVDDPEYIVPTGLRRIEVRLGSGWHVEPYKENPSWTLVTYIANTDLKGLPYFIMNKVLRRHPYALRYIRYQLTETPHHKPCSDSESEAGERGLDLLYCQSEESDQSRTRTERYVESLPLHHYMPNEQTDGDH